MIKCTNCGHENIDGTLMCAKCQTLLTTEKPHTATTRSLDNTNFEEGVPRWGSARFGATMHLVINVLETTTEFAFEADEITKLEIGRIDPNTGEAPAIDLTQAGGLDKGVSRHHAEIIRRDGALHIMDNSSSNGTYLNGQRLVADQPRILRDGDDIRLGHLVLRVTFRMQSAQATTKTNPPAPKSKINIDSASVGTKKIGEDDDKKPEDATEPEKPKASSTVKPLPKLSKSDATIAVRPDVNKKPIKPLASLKSAGKSASTDKLKDEEKSASTDKLKDEAADKSSTAAAASKPQAEKASDAATSAQASSSTDKTQSDPRTATKMVNVVPDTDATSNQVVETSAVGDTPTEVLPRPAAQPARTDAAAETTPDSPSATPADAHTASADTPAESAPATTASDSAPQQKPTESQPVQEQSSQTTSKE